MASKNRKTFHKKKPRLINDSSLVSRAKDAQQYQADMLAIDKPQESLQTLLVKQQKALQDLKKAQNDGDNYKAKKLTDELEKLGDQISGLTTKDVTLKVAQNDDSDSDLLELELEEQQDDLSSDLATPRAWNSVLEKDANIKGLTTCGDADTLKQQKRKTFGMPEKAEPPFRVLSTWFRKKLNAEELKQYEIDLAAHKLKTVDDEIKLKNTQEYNAKVWTPMAKKDGANSYKKQHEVVSLANNGDSDAQLKVKHKTRILPHTTKDETLMGAETGFMIATAFEDSTRALVGAKKDSDLTTDDETANAMVPWIQTNDLYTATTFQGDTGWPNLVKLLNESDSDNNKDFVIMTGSHMDQLGLASDKNGDVNWNYGADLDSSAENGWRPTHFYQQDVDGAKALLKEQPDLNIEIRDIWHPDLPKPTIDSLRAEIKAIIKSGKICIIPSCYSSDLFMKNKVDPKDSKTTAQFENDLITKRNIAIDEFVSNSFGDLDDFKRPK